MNRDGGKDFKEHLLSRNYDYSLYVNQTIDEENNLLTVHLFNYDGKFIGYQRYNPLGSKQTYPLNEAKYMTYTMRGEHAFWGLETIDFDKKHLFVVEGLFKASCLHRLGLNAICIMGNNPNPLKHILLKYPFTLVGVGDADKAGMDMNNAVVKMGGEYLLLSKDVDEYSLDELESIMLINRYM